MLSQRFTSWIRGSTVIAITEIGGRVGTRNYGIFIQAGN